MTEKTEWKDATGYSQGQRGKVEPSAWETRIAGIRIYVTCGHIYHKGEWVMNSDELGFERAPLGFDLTADKEDVFKKAISMAALRARSKAQKFAAFEKYAEGRE